jgi:hypothetical protein
MKTFFTFILAAIFTTSVFATAASAPAPSASSPKTKQVCKVKKDKVGKDVKTCKTIKIHKKLDGKPVPSK